MTRGTLVVAAVAAVLLAGCGTETRLVASISGKGELPSSPAELEACIHRFDDNPQYDGSRNTGGGHPIWQRWFDTDVDAMQAATARVLPGRYSVAKGVFEGSNRPGWVVDGQDPVRMRFVALVDPEVADIAALAQEMAAAVDAEHRRNPKTTALDAVVLPSCFRQSELAAVERELRAEFYPDQPLQDEPCRVLLPTGLDSRVHVGVSTKDRPYGQRLAERFGAILDVSYDVTCGPGHA